MAVNDNKPWPQQITYANGHYDNTTGGSGTIADVDWGTTVARGGIIFPSQATYSLDAISDDVFGQPTRDELVTVARKLRDVLVAREIRIISKDPEIKKAWDRFIEVFGPPEGPIRKQPRPRNRSEARRQLLDKLLCA